MTTKDDIPDDENPPSSGRTSSSSDSYSYLLRDLENPSNDISEEWETIERTLYQESGKHVTDPVLLKECKLWRETFPHIRVTGTAIKKEEGEREGVAESKSVQAQGDNRLPLSKINEKREKIKKAVVAQIVERLISKLNLNEESFENNSNANEKIIEINNKQDKSILNVKSPEIKHEKESYYERGKNDKMFHMGTDSKLSDKDNTSNVKDYFDHTFNSVETRNKAHSDSLWIGSSSYDVPFRNGETKSKATTILAKNEEILRSGHLKLSVTDKRCNRLKNERPFDSLANIAKPFEATKKIDKKYEGLLERILDNKGYNIPVNSSKRSPESVLKSLNDSAEKTRFGLDVGRGNTRKGKQLPKLNSFKNNWLSNAEENLSLLCGMNVPVGRNYSTGNTEKKPKIQSCRSAINPSRYEKSCLGDLEREMSKYAYSGGKEYEGEINLRRSRWQSRYDYNSNANTQKSRSCGDLPKKNPKPKTNDKSLKVNLEKGKSELVLRNGAKKKPGKKASPNQTATNLQLPPIETSIICTEIIARPKISGRTLPKRYF